MDDICKECGVEIEMDITNVLGLCKDCYKKDVLCPECGSSKEFEYRMVDIDGTNLVEYLCCPDCGYNSFKQ